MKQWMMMAMAGILGLTGSMAQTVVPVAPVTTNTIPQSFADVGGSLAAWVSSFDTNITTFTATKLDLWTAMNYQHGLNTSAELGVSYDLWSHVGFEAVAHNLGAGGDVMSEQAGVNAFLVYYDLKLTGYVDAGYSQADSSALVEFGGRAGKAISAHTAAMIGIAGKAIFRSQSAITPTYTVGLTITF